MHSNQKIALYLWSLLMLVAVTSAKAQLINSEWNTGSGDWNIATNWFPNDVPDNGGGLTYDVEIGNRAIAVGAFVDLVPEDGTSDTITSLTVSGGADLNTNGNALFVTGQTTISGAGSSVLVNPATGGGIAFNTDNLDINGGALQMSGGTADIDVLLEVNTGSITGHGLVIVGDADAVVETALENSASIILGNTSNAVLTLQANGVDTLDLDGTTETGTLDVANVNANAGFDTLTLVVDGPLSDSFSGTILVGQRDTITFNDDFTMNGADVQLDGPSHVATMNGLGDVTNIQSSTFTITGDAAIGNDLIFSGPGNLVTINPNSSLTLSGTVSLPPASFNFASSTAELIVTGSFSTNVVGDDFNWDGPGTATTTVSGSGQMTINVDHVDSGNDTYGGTLNLNDSAAVSVNNTANEWTVAGTINKNNAGTATLSGDRVVVTGAVNVSAGTLDLPAVTTTPTANVNATGTLLFGSSSVLGGGTIAGTGLLRMEGTSNVSANTTVGVTTFDWDGIGTGTTHTINTGATLTINSAALDSDGDMDDPLSLAGNLSQLIVNNTNGLTQWTMNGVVTGNASGAGTATIGGTSRMIVASTINVDGNTTISAPVTFNGLALVADIDAGMTLDVTSNNAIYADGMIDGAGTFDPGTTNTVTGDFTINADRFDLDGGSWTIESGAVLTFNAAVDYEPDSVTNSFENTITLNNGGIFANVSDPAVVMNGTLNMNASGGFSAAEWQGDAIEIGNDAGLLDANLNVTGDGNVNSQARFIAPVTFKSDADVNIPAGASLALFRTVNFDTVNATNNAEFTGAGAISFSDDVNVNEAVTLNMVGSTVDLDGNDAIGDFVNIDAPMTINAATLTGFGRVNGGGGVNTLDVNNSVGTGVLTVNLDDPAAEWTLNGPGVMNLVNDNTEATLLAGSDVNVNGTVNVTGDVRSTARLDIAGVVNINTAGQPLRLGGGNNANDPNTLVGGTIGGAGLLVADLGVELRGFGTINTGVDFDGNLFADDGTLTVNGAILDAARVGTRDGDGVLNIVNPWDTSVSTFVQLEGGELKGGTTTINNLNGVSGFGLVSSRVINNVRLRASEGTLVVQTAGNDNDWDGAGAGELRAINAGTLELRDVGAAFGFTGKVSAVDNSLVFANGFALDFNPGSTIDLTQSTYKSSSITNVGGTVTIGAGGLSTLDITNNSLLNFEPTSTTTLNGDLQLKNNNINIDAGATFAGTGALIVPDGSHMVMDAGVTANVLLSLGGDLRPGGFNGLGQVTVKDFQMAPSGILHIEIIGTALNQHDRVSVTGIAEVDGELNLDIDEISPGVPFVPSLGQTFNIISASSGVVGQFDSVVTSGMPAGLTFKVNYLPTIVQVEVIAGAEYETWIHLFTSLTNPSDRLRTADPDGDGQNNLMEFALDGDPTSAVNSGKVVAKIAPVGGVNALTLTFPVRYANTAIDTPDPDYLVGGLTTPNLRYRVFGSDDLITADVVVSLVTGFDASDIQQDLPPLSSGWSYITCRSAGPVAGDPSEFMYIRISEATP